MALTRPSGFPIVSDAAATVTQEVAEVDGRGRLHLLPRWTKRIEWWVANAKDVFKVLMVFVEPGLISLRDWTSDGARITARYEELATRGDDEALEALRLIQDRYKQLPIDKERRPYLSDAAMAHLGLPIARGISSTVYIAVYPNRLDILSPSYRDAKMNIGSRWLDDLP